MTTPTISEDVLEACVDKFDATEMISIRKKVKMEAALIEYDKRVCEPLRNALTEFDEDLAVLNENSRNTYLELCQRINSENAALARVKELENQIENIGEFRLHRLKEF